MMPLLIPLNPISYALDPVGSPHFHEGFNAIFEEAQVALANDSDCINRRSGDLNIRQRRGPV